MALAVSAALHAIAIEGVFRGKSVALVESTAAETMMPVAAMTVTLQSTVDLQTKPVDVQAHEAEETKLSASSLPEVRNALATKPERVDLDEPRPPAEEGAVEQSPVQNTVAAELPPAPSYVKSSELDPPPTPLNEIAPEYPEAGGVREGFVVLRILINEQGKIDNLAVVRSFPQGVFDHAALSAFGSAGFSPGMRFGVPVKSQLTIEVHFTPDTRGGNVSGRGY